MSAEYDRTVLYQCSKCGGYFSRAETNQTAFGQLCKACTPAPPPRCECGEIKAELKAAYEKINEQTGVIKAQSAEIVDLEVKLAGFKEANRRQADRLAEQQEEIDRGPDMVHLVVRHPCKAREQIVGASVDETLALAMTVHKFEGELSVIDVKLDN